MPDPDSRLPDRLHEVVEMALQSPRLLRARSAVSAQVDCEHAVAFAQPFLGKPPEAPSVPLHTVHADDPGRVPIAPLPSVEAH